MFDKLKDIDQILGYLYGCEEDGARAMTVAGLMQMRRLIDKALGEHKLIHFDLDCGTDTTLRAA